MWCHLPLALPVLGVVLFFLFPLAVAAPLYAIVLLASLIMYRMIVQALRLPVKTGVEGMAGGLAYVVEPLAPEGVVRYGGELWRAMGHGRIEQGARVRIERVDGMTVVVHRETPCDGGESVPPCQ